MTELINHLIIQLILIKPHAQSTYKSSAVVPKEVKRMRRKKLATTRGSTLLLAPKVQ